MTSSGIMKYHPSIGCTYVPNLRQRIRRAAGGYLLQTNSSGFRANSEFVHNRPRGKRRILFFGDSQTAGDGVSNQDRFSELVERNLENCEVYNYAISGTGIDQHFLAYREFGQVECDLIVVCIYVENICRVWARFIEIPDEHGEAVVLAKPYFFLADGDLKLSGVPVSPTVSRKVDMPASVAEHIYSFNRTNLVHGSAKAILRRIVPDHRVREGLRHAFVRSTGFQPLPEYLSAGSPQWRLMQSILSTWAAETKAPVVLVTLPHHYYLSSPKDAVPYQTRFSEFSAEFGVAVHDTLPAMLNLSSSDRALVWDKETAHLTVRGHQAIAEQLKSIIVSHIGSP